MSIEEFYKSSWFLERPIHIQELFRKFEVNKPWFLKLNDEDRYYEIRIKGWDEPKEGKPTAMYITKSILDIQ